MIKELLLVGAGSFTGGICRYLISLLTYNNRSGFPWGTFIVNIVGCLFIGLLWGWSSRNTSCFSWINLFLMVGFCGGFTTFSTFSKESLSLLQTGNYTLFFLYIICSVVIGISTVFLGFSSITGKVL